MQVSSFAYEYISAPLGRSAFFSAIYGPSGDVKWSEADPTYSLEAAKRGS
jgi:hypothetical protein